MPIYFGRGASPLSRGNREKKWLGERALPLLNEGIGANELA